jgi:gas vesicle protein
MSDSRNDGVPILLAFLAGAVIGAGLGLLFAPHPGKETREQLADLARRAREKAAEIAGTLRRDAARGAAGTQAGTEA